MLANSALLKGELEEEGSRGPGGQFPQPPCPCASGLGGRVRQHIWLLQSALGNMAKVGAAIVRRTPASAGTGSSVGQAALESGLVRQTKQAPTLAFVGFRGHCGGSTGRSKDQVSA